jgi:hypothetical protein
MFGDGHLVFQTRKGTRRSQWWRRMRAERCLELDFAKGVVRKGMVEEGGDGGDCEWVEGVG